MYSADTCTPSTAGNAAYAGYHTWAKESCEDACSPGGSHSDVACRTETYCDFYKPSTNLRAAGVFRARCPAGATDHNYALAECQKTCGICSSALSRATTRKDWEPCCYDPFEGFSCPCPRRRPSSQVVTTSSVTRELGDVSTVCSMVEDARAQYGSGTPTQMGSMPQATCKQLCEDAAECQRATSMNDESACTLYPSSSIIHAPPQLGERTSWTKTCGRRRWSADL